MDDIDLEKLEEIFAIIKDAPALRIGYFCDNAVVVAKTISKFCKSKEYEFVLNATTQEYANFIKESIDSVKFFNLNRAKYMLNGKFYDYIFVNCTIKNKESFLQKIHSVIKNGGNIIIFVKSNDYMVQDEYKLLLEENYFVATSSIKIDNNYTAIVSRKMHGWGG